MSGEGFVCESCGKSLDTKAGLRSHERACESPWRDEETLRELYVEKGLSRQDIGERLGCSGSAVRNWLSEFGISADDRAPPPWQDKETLRELRLYEGLTVREIGERLGSSSGIISRWLVALLRGKQFHPV